MNFAEVDLFGVYVAPISVMMVAAWLVLIALRRVADHFGLLRHVWHPALFVFACYMITLSSIVLIIAR
jgi:protein AaeX